ncbi:MAG: MarR family transcriptional regulator [Sphaerochaeta sp.]|jgi:DNA-binding MarR family transcriptional regulator|nr:MarR family transcriptional regulator [Spirochaetales bacterium]
MDMQEMKAKIFSSFFTLSNRLQVAGDGLDAEMTLKQWLLIAVLIKSEEEALPVSELARRMGSSRQNVMKMAQLLEKQGFITIGKREDDKRFSDFRVTSRCLAHCKGRQEREEHFIETLFSGFSYDELAMLSRSFAKLAENIALLEETYA